MTQSVDIAEMARWVGHDPDGSMSSASAAPAGTAGRSAPAEHVGVASFVGFDADGTALLEAPRVAPSKWVRAMATIPLEGLPAGSAVVYMSDTSQPLPIVLGIIRRGAVGAASEAPGRAVIAELDGDRLELSARREVVLRCGEASITLKSNGRVVIQGRYVLSRSSGYNKIKGAVVDIN